MTLREIAQRRGQSAEDAVMDLLIEEHGAVRIINIHLADQDVDRLLAHACAMIGSDAFTMNLANPLAISGHPRCFGTFPRILGEYARERRILTWEEAIRKMTSLPAEKFHLEGRGRIARGACADIVVFDGSQVGDRASYARPATPPTGIRHVLVNGMIALDGGRLTGARNGRVLRGGGSA
jgi:N-acyl-D-amino-acid deacylase